MTRHLIIAAFLVLLGSSTTSVSMMQDLIPYDKGSPTSVENFVQEMFQLSRNSGSVTLKGTCMATGRADDQVVSDALPHPPEGPFHTIDDAITALSRIEPHLSWNRDADGLLRVHDDRVQNDILGIHLHRVHFSGAVNPDVAIWDVLSTPEVRSYFKKYQIEDGLVFNDLAPLSTKGFPRLSGDIGDVTVAEALDRVMRFFPGVWIYSECQDGTRRRVMVRGIQVRRPGEPSTNIPLGRR